MKLHWKSLLAVGILSSISMLNFWWILDIYAYTIHPWSLENISLIPRTQWITDESIIYRKTQTTNPDSNSGQTSTDSITTTRNNYLSELFPKQYRLDDISRIVDDKQLVWPREYKSDKTHIIIHHTVNDLEKVTTPEEAKIVINSIFRSHALTNQRWDIGYNFIIDPWWTIYEGRGGGADVVGAHSPFNNSDSIGIALLWNFEVNEPTEEQMKSLINLSTAVAKYYDINPYTQVYSHMQSSTYPYIKDVVTDSIMWHKDTRATACPWVNLYNKLPEIKKNIFENLKTNNTLPREKPLRTVIPNEKEYILYTNSSTLLIPIESDTPIIRCTTNATNIVVSCTQNTTKELKLLVSKKDVSKLANKDININITTKWLNPNLRTLIHVKRNSDQLLELEDRRKNYIEKNGILPTPLAQNKIKEQIDLSSIRELAKKDVTVLLYEASTSLPQRDILCQDCRIEDESWNIYTDKSFTIINQQDNLFYQSKTSSWVIQSIHITPNSEDRATFILNYPRTSFNGTAWNNFYGTITIDKQPIKLLDQPNITTQYVVTNTLPLELYMRWIIESNDSEPLEKNKAMSLISKNYILFYLHPSHRHPSIPEWARYNAVDDARIFQKYAGAGVDLTLTKRRQALEATANQVVTYNGNLVILPYFSCSAWFTWSAQEKYWRQDTPYLISVYDPAPCDDFNGHGVWLAGNWAKFMANNGSSYEDIIQYFYPGVSLSTY